MIDQRAESLGDFDRLLTDPPGYGCLLRGVPNAAYELLPSVGRLLPSYLAAGLDRAELLRHERRAFDLFCEDGAALFPSSVKDDLDLLVIARHHGLRTRLLDWTFNPLVALYFAVCAEMHDPGAVYVLSNTALLPDRPPTTSVFDLSGVCVVTPRHVSSRITRQSGALTVHGDPTKKFDSPHLQRIVIPRSAKPEILRRLRWYGVNEAALFPELDGLARHVNSLAFFSIVDQDVGSHTEDDVHGQHG